MLLPAKHQAIWEQAIAQVDEDDDVDPNVAKDITRKILAKEELEGAQVGKTKVFLRAGGLGGRSHGQAAARASCSQRRRQWC